MQPARPTRLALLALALLAALALHLATGDIRGGLHWPESWPVASLRLHRALVATAVGASLACAGVLLQALVRNPLASPDLLGVTSGAGLGVTVASFVAFATGAAPIAAPASQTAAAFVGASATLAAVLAWTHRRGGIDLVSLVLVGVIVGMTCAGATLILHHLMPDRGFAASAWLLGAIDEDLPPALLAAAWLALAASVALALTLARAIDTATLGEDEARSLGVRLARLRLALFLAAGLLTTMSVVLAGPIGFVGLIIPHAVRMVLGPHHRPLIVGAAIAGAATLVAADAAVSAFPLARGGRLPLGVLTAVVGGPLFLLLLRSTLRRRTL